MSADTIQEFKEDFSLLIEAGFVAVKQLDEVSATRIFQAAQVLSPTSTAPQVGLGYIALNKLEVKEATKIFEEINKKEPENYLAQTFLGMCFLLSKSKQKKGEKLIQNAMEKATDPVIKNLGALALEWGERDLKKKDLPFFKAQRSEEEGSVEKETMSTSEGAIKPSSKK